MNLYYPSLEAIEKQTRELEAEICHHCHQANQLVSHGHVRKKRNGSEPESVGKRVYCSTRNSHTGCGRTIQLYLASVLKALHYAGSCLIALMEALFSGLSVQPAYQKATGTASPRNAYRWLSKLEAQSTAHRTLVHNPVFKENQTLPTSGHRDQIPKLFSTLNQLKELLGEPLCGQYQITQQTPFV